MTTHDETLEPCPAIGEMKSGVHRFGRHRCPVCGGKGTLTQSQAAEYEKRIDDGVERFWRVNEE